jgi:hypothetical protein
MVLTVAWNRDKMCIIALYPNMTSFFPAFFFRVALCLINNLPIFAQNFRKR